MGFDQPDSIHEHGAVAALPVWMDFMKNALAGKPEHSMLEPDDITSVRIDPETGLLAQPGQEDAIFELFTKETVQQKKSSENSDEDDDSDNTSSTDSSDTNDNQLF